MEYELSRRALLAAAGAALLAVPSRSAGGRSWHGTFVLPAGAEPVALSLTGPQVARGAGPAAGVSSAGHRSGERVRFTVPGRPATLVFDGRLRGGGVAGQVQQGAARGTFRLHAGPPLDARAVGVYRLGSGEVVAVVVLGGSYYAVAFDRGEIRRLYATGPAEWTLGAGVALRDPPAGSVRLAGTTLLYDGAAGTRLAGRQV